MGGDSTPAAGGLVGYAATMLGSATSGMIARFPCHPFDTCKARLQVQTSPKSSAAYKNLLHTLRKTWRHEGLFGLYRGFGITVLGSAPASCLYFTTYEVTREKLTSTAALSDYTFVAHFFAGMLAEAVSCALWVPIDVIKERQQIRTHPVTALSIFRSQGLSGLYRGYGATLASFGPFSATYFLCYEQFKTLARSLTGVKPDEPLSFAAFMLSGAASGTVASFVTNPLDMAKLRLQVQRGAEASAAAGAASAGEVTFQYRGFLHALAEIQRTEGTRGLWKGAGARMAFHAPMTALSITLFEECKLFYQAMLTQREES